MHRFHFSTIYSYEAPFVTIKVNNLLSPLKKKLKLYILLTALSYHHNFIKALFSTLSHSVCAYVQFSTLSRSINNAYNREIITINKCNYFQHSNFSIYRPHRIDSLIRIIQMHTQKHINNIDSVSIYKCGPIHLYICSTEAANTLQPRLLLSILTK